MTAVLESFEWAQVLFVAFESDQITDLLTVNVHLSCSSLDLYISLIVTELLERLEKPNTTTLVKCNDNCDDTHGDEH
jgi:hypothetical protein